MIVTDGLTKIFTDNKKKTHTDITAVENLSLTVNEGEVFGFLGPNGAGKTTTVRLLACLIAPTRGQATISGLPITRAGAQIRGQIGILTEAPGHYERLSTQYNLEIFARLYHTPDVKGQVEKYLRLLDLWDRRTAAAGTLSKGMKQKLAIARALLHEPPVLFLDEPTSGLDPEAARTVRDFIETLKGQGRTIFICTHNLDEAERLCDRIAIFRQRLIAVGAPEALRRQLFGRQTIVQLAAADAPNLAALLQALRSLAFVRQVEETPALHGAVQLTISLSDPPAQNPAIVHTLVSQGAQVQFVSERQHALEEVYFSLVNAPAQNGGKL
ncbi:MAG: ABC transporter ATP-binding protein [Anaerolineae bacterium]